LASRLTGWRIDVRSEAEAEEETRRARQSIGAIPGINDMVAELLYQAGFKSAEEVADSELEEILDVEGVSKDKAEALYKSAREYVAEKQKKEQEAQAAAQAAAAAVSEGQPVEEKQPQES
jgi:N utilization substance protein A